MRRLIAAAVVVLATATLLPAGLGVASAAAPAAEPASVPGQPLVGYQRGASAAHRADARSRANAKLVERVVGESGDRTAVELVTFTGVDRGEAIRRFTANPNVAFAEPNWVYTHADTADDTHYVSGALWGMYGDDPAAGPVNPYGSQAAEAWAAGNTGDGTVYVGIIDEGYQYDHPDLVDNAGANPGEVPGDGIDNDGNGYVDDVHGWDFDGNNNSVYDGADDDHGTHVAGTIGAKGGNGVGVAGVVWDVKLISAKFLGVNGGTTANAVKAVDYLTDLKARHGINLVATNNSWGGGSFSQALKDAITRANAQNIAFVAAAGNDGRNNDVTAAYPANYDVPNVITVAALDKSGNKASWSNYGATTVDLGAPGVGIMSTLPGGTYGSYSGTSMATPHVTGSVALLAAANPGMSVATIRQIILATAVKTAALDGKTVTGGRLNAGSFLAGALPPARWVTVTVGVKKKAATPITVNWSGFAGSSVDLYRNGTKSTTPNDGSFSDSLKGSGSVTYKVCETGTSVCAQASTAY